MIQTLSRIQGAESVKRRTAPKKASRGPSAPLIIGGLTVVGVLAVLAVANLMPKGGGGPAAGAGAAVAHDVGRTSNGPDIHFGVTEVDLGTIPLGKEVGYAFSYANIGNDTLRIDDVRVRVLEGC